MITNHDYIWNRKNLEKVNSWHCAILHDTKQQKKATRKGVSLRVKSKNSFLTLSKSFLSDLVDSVVISEGIPCCFCTLYALYFEKKGLFSDLLVICEYFILFFSIAQTYLLGYVTGKSNLAGWSADFCPVKLQQKKYIFERISNKLPLFFSPQDA